MFYTQLISMFKMIANILVNWVNGYLNSLFCNFFISTGVTYKLENLPDDNNNDRNDNNLYKYVG